jgi:hypothetical protein
MSNDNSFSSPIFPPNMEISPVPDYAYEVQHDNQQGEMFNMFNFEVCRKIISLYIFFS